MEEGNCAEAENTLLYEQEPEYESISETDEEEDEYEELNFSTLNCHSYVSEAKDAIYKNEIINTENAIELNQTFVKVLIELRTKLEDMVQKCKERYEFNEMRLNKAKLKSDTKFRGKKGSHYVCGMPFFKNSRYESAPANQDYLYRKYTLKEFFPVDLILQPIKNWTSNDKSELVLGIKSQLVNFLETDYKQTLIDRKLIDSKNFQNLNSFKFVQLYDMAKGSDFKIKWHLISASDLQTRHTPEACLAMWNGYFLPDLNRGHWTNTEENQLIKATKKYKCQNWEEISKAIPRRSAFQCFLQYQSKLSSEAQVKNAKWTKDEDDLLINAIAKSRMGNYVPWCKVAECIPGRNKMQTYHRYMLSLNPNIKHEKFTVEEDCYLMAAIEQYGANFSAIPSDILPGRTTVQLRNHFNYVLKETSKRKGIKWTLEEDIKLVDFVKKNGFKKWAEIASILGNHNRMGCRARYSTITEYLKKHPEATIEHVPRKIRRQNTLVTRDNFIDTIIKLKRGENVDMRPKPRQYIPKKANLPYYESLNKADKSLFDLFKYCYNFKYTSNYNLPMYKTINVHILSRLFHVNLDSEIIGKNCKKFSVGEMTELCQITDIDLSIYEEELEKLEYSELTIPPNLNNTLLFRGLTIMFNDLTEVSSSKSATAKKTPANVAAAEKFKKRLYSLLYWPTILSQLETSSVNIDDEPIHVTTSDNILNNFNNDETIIEEYSIINTESGQTQLEKVSEVRSQNIYESNVETEEIENESESESAVDTEDSNEKVVLDMNTSYTISIMKTELTENSSSTTENKTSKIIKRKNNDFNKSFAKKKKI